MNNDLISREALKKAIKEWKYHGFYDKFIEVINNAPTVERPQGEWDEYINKEGYKHFKGICPYTNKHCKLWLCDICSVEYEEERYARGERDD